MSTAGNSSYMGYANDPEGLGIGAPSALRNYGHIVVGYADVPSTFTYCLSNSAPFFGPNTINDFSISPCGLTDDDGQLALYWVRDLSPNFSHLQCI